ncbi:hypothetical protein PGTUg99_015837 [Puccinia graminis f. sp. tritici]|uniref:Uncharacterized protein n=1 Tax=Puccinia graminis f. sp. tritici TaxID=56615 RepID=A0A5B0RQF6_PUCGR|nr:hypothetical protein PGTUg99_015837 [Puccinia graminis f. sp. tritici]
MYRARRCGGRTRYLVDGPRRRTKNPPPPSWDVLEFATVEFATYHHPLQTVNRNPACGGNSRNEHLFCGLITAVDILLPPMGVPTENNLALNVKRGTN